jgi:hypothetical protein
MSETKETLSSDFHNKDRHAQIDMALMFLEQLHENIVGPNGDALIEDEARVRSIVDHIMSGVDGKYTNGEVTVAITFLLAVFGANFSQFQPTEAELTAAREEMTARAVARGTTSKGEN